jgi:hypothetical protein
MNKKRPQSPNVSWPKVALALNEWRLEVVQVHLYRSIDATDLTDIYWQELRANTRPRIRERICERRR